jgi:hypothetical protein
MATKKVIDMTARSSSNLAYDDFVYLTKEVPLTDEKMQASVMRDYVLSGVKTSANSGLAQTSTPYATSNPDRELSLDVTNLTASGGTASVTDYIAIDQGAGIKKLLVGDLPFASSASSVASLIGGTNVNVSAATGNVTVNVDTTMTGLTSVTSTAFAGALTGNASTATALETARTIGGTSFDGTAAIVPATITVADTTDTTAYVGLWESATGDLEPKTDTGITYNAGTGMLTATGFTGPLTGNADTATALAGTLGVAGGGTGMTSIAKGGVIVSSAADTFSALLGGVGEDGYVLTYNETADTLTWEPHAGSAGTVSSVAISGTDGIDVDSGSPITTSGTITLGLSGIADAAISSAATWNAKQNALTFGIADTNSVVIDSASVVDNDYAKFTTSGLEGRTASEVKTDLSLDNVENTALSTWAGSTNITTLGTIATGTWEGTTVALDQGGTGMTSIAKGSVLVANAANTLSAASGVTDGHVLTYTSATDTVGWGAVPSSGDPAGTAVAMAIALGG